MSNNIASEIIFKATNKQHKDKGMPPQIGTSGLNKYCAYFENEFSEQFIFVYDHIEHAGTLWLSKKGWEKPFSVVDGKAHKAGLSRFEKTWLKGCWNVVMTVEHRRNYIQEMIRESPASSIASDSSSRAEIVASMSHLYDFLAKTELKPDCTKQAFVTGWTDLIELVARIEKKKMANPK